MEQCEICGSTAMMYVEDEDIDETIAMCHTCYKKMFGSPPISCSMMYT